MTLLKVQSISKNYGKLPALDNISFSISEGTALGVVGESGSGKSTLIKSILSMESIHSGRILFLNQDIHKLKGKQKRELYKDIQIIMQDPSTSLNAKLPVWKSMVEPISNFRDRKDTLYPNLSLFDIAKKVGKMVGLKEEHLTKYPHELSGGQKQRVSIARGISLHPRLLILDEPTSSLDVSIQAQILMLLKSLKKELQTSFLFVSHDLKAVRFLCDEIVVLKEGKLLERFSSDDILQEERHDYTKQLVRYTAL
ncbi:dipeptide/oligopeptide/nickel ABC transporter ATP-binding protein [Metabacillus litoralis]|uniref:ABC transporter ATP-binding protein n=1 Tax=Metabacillus TaxID=2675233 RepID=UPI001B9C7580|nr:dipeptide/oligopeptide/nickel ABC transporter ATP-binding protein [Metabacillus litoralis]UHA59059.1 dipeptide/oligopeptide/nickel ABC transporter ATP-binding protein [Metabacillus litoralis]